MSTPLFVKIEEAVAPDCWFLEQLKEEITTKEMDETVKGNETGRGQEPNESIPDEERRRILKKLAACAFAAPAAMLLLDGGDNITYAGTT